MILVGGEALYDLVVQEEGDELRGHPGGGPFNTARTVGRLGQPVAYLGRLSSDRFGRRLETLLVDDGVNLDCVVRTDEPTTLAIAEVDRSGVARYRFYARATAAPGLTPEEALAALPPAVDAVRALLERGPAAGLLTRGPNGAVVVTRTAEVAVPAPAATVVDTIGAGDAFGDGFVAWWSERGLGRDDLGRVDLVVEATEFACLVAARTCSRPGASPPWRDEL